MEFDKWFWEIEGFHIRSEKFWDDVENNRREQIYKWMQTAYQVGYNDGKRLYGGTK